MDQGSDTIAARLRLGVLSAAAIGAAISESGVMQADNTGMCRAAVAAWPSGGPHLVRSVLGISGVERMEVTGGDTHDMSGNYGNKDQLEHAGGEPG
jgi:hypothetical protein